MGSPAVIRFRVWNALTNVYQCWMCLYFHLDGDKVAAKLRRFLAPFRLVNGIPIPGEPNVRYANGPGCLFAQIVAAFKGGPGDVYVEPADAPSQQFVVNLDVDMRNTSFAIVESHPR